MTEAVPFILHLADRVEPLRQEVSEHQARYGEMLPHVLMADISRLAGRLAGEAQDGSASAQGALEQLVSALEQGLSRTADRWWTS